MYCFLCLLPIYIRGKKRQKELFHAYFSCDVRKSQVQILSKKETFTEIMNISGLNF